MAVESLVWFLIVVAIFGLIVGAVGRLLIPGPTPLGVLGTMGAGVAGAFVGGLVGRLLLGPNLTQGWMWVLSILGATLVVWVVSRRRGAYGGGPRRPRLMSEHAYGNQAVDRPYRAHHGHGWLARRGYGDTYGNQAVADDVDRSSRSHHSRWSWRDLLPRRGHHGRAAVDGIGRPYRPVGRRRRWLA